MTALKTARTTASVQRFVNAIPNATRREECVTLLRLMKAITRSNPAMWGPSIVGFGNYHYKYGSGREGEWFFTGFSPRKQALTVYIMAGVRRYPALLERLGKCTTGVSCLYLKRLSDVNLSVLEEMIRRSIDDLKQAHR